MINVDNLTITSNENSLIYVCNRRYKVG